MIAQAELVELPAEAMEQRGYSAIRHGDWLEHRDSEITIHPVALESVLSPSSVRSVVVVTTNHPRFPPDGILEYQHAAADTEREAICEGLDQWLQMDFTVLLDALRDRPEHCAAMEWQPQPDKSPERLRRVLLGPVGHWVAQPERASANTEHPFCPCCLFTNTYQAFQPLLEVDDFCGIRLLASRNEAGLAQADCRINGSDWESGKLALCAYATTWPQAGFEMRKQYVVMQSFVRRPG